jgi:hypothetical protein
VVVVAAGNNQGKDQHAENALYYDRQRADVVEIDVVDIKLAQGTKRIFNAISQPPPPESFSGRST